MKIYHFSKFEIAFIYVKLKNHPELNADANISQKKILITFFSENF